MLIYASWIEVLQLVLALLGVAIGFWRVWIAVQNVLLVMSTNQEDLRRVIAETQIIGELFRLFKLGCLLAMGVISILLPPPNYQIPDSIPENLQGFLIRCGLITLTLAMVTDSAVQEYRRRHFMNEVRDKYERPSSAAKSDEQAKSLHASIQKVADKADAAYEEANTINKKLEQMGLASKAKADAIEASKTSSGEGHIDD